MPRIRHRRIEALRRTLSVEIPLPPPDVILPPFVGDGFRLTAADDRLVINHTAVPANNFVGLPVPPKVIDTRAGTAYYTDAAGIFQLAPINALRRDKDKRLLQPGYLIEIQNTNNLLQSNAPLINRQVPATGGSGTFIDGETVQGTGGGTGTYVESCSTPAILALTGATGTWTLGSPITGLTSGATRSSANNYLQIWDATGFTFAKNQTGPDGIANSATRLTSSGATGTATQAASTSNQLHYVSAYIRRVSGTSPIEMTVAGGIWTAVNPTSEWTRCDAIPGVQTTTPVSGIRVLTPPGETDVIDVWCFQLETKHASSPIPTFTAQVTRAPDQVRMAASLFPYNTLEGTLYARCMHMSPDTGSSGGYSALDDGTTTKSIGSFRAIAKTAECNVYNTSLQVQFLGAVTIPGMTEIKTAVGYKLNNTGFSSRGEATQLDTACTIPVCNNVSIGGRGGSITNVEGWVFELEYRPTRETDLQLSARTVP